LAESTGRELARVEGQMKKLVELNILDQRMLGSQFYYRYIPPHYVSRRRGRVTKDSSEQGPILGVRKNPPFDEIKPQCAAE
jgi:hypothetical protein